MSNQSICDKQQNIIFQGTTPTFNFNVDIDTSNLDLANTHIMFTSGAGEVDKYGDDIFKGKQSLSCTLTQDDTMMFKGNTINIQILATFDNGTKAASVIKSIPTSAVLGGEAW